MNFKQIVAVSAAAMAFSANAALFVTSDSSVNANVGRTDGPGTSIGPAVFIFSTTSDVTLSSIGVFDQDGDGFVGGGGGLTLQVWRSTGGNTGEAVGSAFTFLDAGQDLRGDGNEWRVQSANIALLASQTYAISVSATANLNDGFFYGYGGNFNAYDLGSNTSGRTASYASGVFDSTVVVLRGLGNAVSADNVFNQTGAVSSTNFRIVTGEFTAVPEPSTYALVAGAGLAGFGLWRRRSTKA